MYKPVDTVPKNMRAAYKIIQKDIDAYLDMIDVIQKNSDIKEELLRGTRIRMSYFHLVSSGVKPKEARYQLADEYFCSVKTVEKHLYRLMKPKRKKTV